LHLWELFSANLGGTFFKDACTGPASGLGRPHCANPLRGLAKEWGAP
jgi:hypothetical protein